MIAGAAKRPTQSVPKTPQEGQWWEGGRKIESRQEFTTRRLDTQLDKLTRNKAGRRSQTKTERKRGRYIQARVPKGKLTDLAFDATLRAAAPHQIRRDRSKLALALEKQDLREKVRVRPVSFLTDANVRIPVEARDKPAEIAAGEGLLQPCWLSGQNEPGLCHETGHGTTPELRRRRPSTPASGVCCGTGRKQSFTRLTGL